MKNAKLTAYVDGGARGNPGPAAAAAVLFSDGKEIGRACSFLQTRTNNQAEYEAVLLALTEAQKRGAKELEIFSDSELVVNQLNRNYKVKHGGLQPLFVKCWNAMQSFTRITIAAIPREKNTVADALVNDTLDKNG